MLFLKLVGFGISCLGTVASSPDVRPQTVSGLRRHQPQGYQVRDLGDTRDDGKMSVLELTHTDRGEIAATCEKIILTSHHRH